MANLFGIFKKTSIIESPPCKTDSIITYIITLVNTSTTTVTNALFIDTMPLGLTFIPGSLTINGCVYPQFNPATGVPLGPIPSGMSFLFVFKVKVTSHLPLYTNLAIIQYPQGGPQSKLLITYCA
ncbi:MAG: hypothetical protein ACRDA5_04230 [Clostridium sp.]